MRKIVAIAMVKNEMDIIESFARHTLGFADLLIVADHKSTDRTREILEALQEEELPVLIEDVAAARHAQAETMTRLLWLAADEHQADLIVLLDADEFLIPTDEASVRDVLETLAIDDVCSLRWQRYLPQSDDGIPAGVFALSVPLLRAKEPEQGQKIIVRGDVVRRDHPGIAEGNHMILREGRVAHGYHGDFCDGLELAHLYWRSPAQICSKFAVGWPNIAGKYSIHTPSGGGYRNPFMRIAHGETPDKSEGIASWTPCNLRGRVPMMTLRYSDNTVPDAFANVMAASEALAQELAETRALATQPVVTTIVPYFGGGGQTSSAGGISDEAFRRTLHSALDEKYPWHEILVLVFGGVIRRVLVQEAMGRGVRLVAPENLLANVQGKYVECLLPGETVHPEKLRRMVTSMELQDMPYPMIVSNKKVKQDSFPSLSPYIELGVTDADNFQARISRRTWQSRLLVSGGIPSCGLAGVLMRRHLFADCSGLLDCFADGRLHPFRIWRTLLLTCEQQPYTNIGIITEDYVGAVPKLSLADIASHQLDWQEACHEDQAVLDAEEQQNIRQRQQAIGRELLAQAEAADIDLAAGIWPTYRQMLATL